MIFLYMFYNIFFEKTKAGKYGISDCRKTSILINVPIKSAGKFEYRQSKGDAFSCKASPLEKQPTGLFFNSPLVNTPSTRDFRSLR